MLLQKLSKRIMSFYLASFLIPICIYGIIILSYQFGLGEIYMNSNSFSYLRIPMLGLSSAAFACYLRHTKISQLQNPYAFLAFATSYGLTSYILSQESNNRILFVYSLFPILFLCYEWMITDRRHIPFIIGNALLLLICPMIGIPVTILLYLLSFFDLSLQKRLHFGEFLHTTCNFIFSIVTGGFGIFFYLAPYYAEHERFSYVGFQLSNDLSIFLSRFFPGAVPSQEFYYHSYKTDLYFGLFAMILVALFFFQHQIAFQKRLYYGIFTLIIIAGIILTPFQYILDFWITSERDTIVFSFILVFWALRLAFEGYSHWYQINKRSIRISTIIFPVGIITVLMGISWCFGAHNFLSWILIVHIILLITALIFLLYFSQQKHPIIHKLLFFLILTELCFNTIVTTNAKFRPKNASCDAAFFCGQNQKNTDSKHKIAEEKYQEYVNNHTDDTTNGILNKISSLYNNHTNNKSSENKELVLANSFERYNIYVHELGISNDLFIPCDVSLRFPTNSVYTITDQGHHIYHITCTKKEELVSGFIPYTIQNDTQTTDPIYLSSYFNNDIIKLDEDLLSGNQFAYLPVDISNGSYVRSYNDQILCYSMDTSVLNQIFPLIEKSDDSPAETKNTSHIKADITGLILSYFGFMALLILLFYNDKKKVYQKLQNIRISLSNAAFPKKIAAYFHQNKVYYLAFILPAFLILSIFIFTGCMPFGDNSMFDEDGIALVLPEYMDYHYNAIKNNTYLSMHAGYATNNYNNTPLIKLYQFYQYLTPSQIIILQHFILLICVGLAGVSMVFYLVHRQNRPVSKQDIRLLLPAMIYSTNAYMLRCHSFNSWYYVYLIFPLLLVAFQRLLTSRKWFSYTLLLSCCIILNIQLGLYICIFLVICFCSHPFHGYKDFFMKGIRFAWSSLLAAGCSFFVISNTMITAQSSRYQQTDAILPSLGFHGNFLTEWKNYMICSPVSLISHHAGDLFAYCGIITLLLTATYFVGRQYSWKEKLRRAIPILFLTISFNGQVLSYLWNGLHYQSNVPNRYTFLLMFLLAEIAYDAIRILPHLSRYTYAYFTIASTIFFLCCQSYADGNTVIAFSVTMILFLLYLLFHLWSKHHNNRQHIYITLLLCVGIFELYCNGLYTSKNWEVSSILSFGTYEDFISNTTEQNKQDSEFYRSNFPLNYLINVGKVFHTNSNGAFNSYVSTYQGNLNTSYGFISSINYITNHSISNPMGLSLSANRYIYVNVYNAKALPDLCQYKALGYYDGYYIFENPYYLSMGYYVPESALSSPDKYKDVLTKSPFQYQNLLAGEYLENEQEINDIYTIDINKMTDTTNQFYVTDEQDNVLSIQEAIKQYQKLDVSEEYKLKLHINYTVPCDGYLYLYANEIIGLDYVQKGQTYQTVINFPNLNPHLTNPYYLAVFQEDVFQTFHNKASQNQLEDISIQNDTIIGTTNYDTDGYTMLSIPYDRGWTAYIDGKEATIENPYDAGIYIKTPAGKHTLTLQFVPYGMKVSQLITYGFWILTILLALCSRYLRKQRS